MAHPRALLRAAAVSLLAAAGTSAGSRVFDHRITPWRVSEVPAINVLVEGETGEESLATPREYQRAASLILEVVDVENDNIAASLDNLAAEVETVMNTNRYLSQTASETTYKSTSALLSADGERPMGVIRLTYEALYVTAAIDASAVLDDFAEADVVYDVGVADPADEAEDTFAVPIV